MHSLSGYSTTDRIKPSGYSSLLFRWLFHNAFILKVAQRMGMKIQSSTLSHNNHKQVPSRQVPLHKREDDERVWLSWNNWMTRKLFHITNSSVIFGCLVGLVCYHQCHRHTWSLGLSCLSSTKFTFILVAWFIFQDYSATNGQSKTHQKLFQ